MANTVLLDQFRKKLAAHMAGKSTLKPLGKMKFGSGGHTELDHQPTTVDPSVTSLEHELLEKEITENLSHNDADYSCSGWGTVELEELIDNDISEVALCDTNGDLLAIEHIRPKHKESDEKYTFTGIIRF